MLKRGLIAVAFVAFELKKQETRGELFECFETKADGFS
jgi:hypothetical protein